MKVDLCRIKQSTHGPAETHNVCEIASCPICDGGLFIRSICGAAEIEAEENTCEEYIALRKGTPHD